MEADFARSCGWPHAAVPAAKDKTAQQLGVKT